MSDTSYAALTRAKAKFGKRLREKDYKSLLDCANVAEVMTYLKSNTHYIEAFGEANERGIRRGLFENLLKQYMNNQFDSLVRFELSVGEQFSNYIAHKTEVNELIRFLTLLNSTEDRREQPFHFVFPAHMAKKTSINLTTLADAKSYEEFLAAIEGTRYEKVFSKYQIKSGESIPITEIENELYIGLYRDLYEIVDKTGSTESAELEDLLDAVMDYENFVRIIRFKKYYKADYKTIAKFLLPFGSLSDKALGEMLTAETSDEVYKIMLRTKHGKLISKTDYNHTGELPLRIKHKKAWHNMYFSDNPATVMLSYIILCEVELHNLIILIEAARYNVDRTKIEPLLIY